LTLLNLFFGIFAIITASRGDFRKAGIYVLLGGIMDALDGKVARAANAGTQFGEELDSLVDAISFGLAPSMIMYFAVLNRDGWDWIFVFLFAACAVMRLARFNIEQAGTSKTYFQGLPSPAAGITLASYYWFSQSDLYTYGAIGNLPWQELLRFLMVALAYLMVSNIPYPVLPRVGFRSIRGLGALVLVAGSLALLFTKQLQFFFPLCVAYVLFGALTNMIGRLFERRQPTVPYDLSEGEDDDEDNEERFEPGSSQVHASRQGFRDPREERRRSPREQAPERTPRPQERPPAAERAERPERKEREERPDRPKRTEEERAARREKREKRDNRQRELREKRRAAGDIGQAPGVEGITLGDTLTDSTQDAEIVGNIPGGAEEPAATSEVARARKRKRRRRRGERKERSGAPGEESGGIETSGDDGETPTETFESSDAPPAREQPHVPDAPHSPSSEPQE
jgi:CDP-diacylglycerol--serine O-phosphatidyltransferase